MNFLCIYLGEKGGGALMHVYVWEHIVSLYYSTAWMDVYETWYGWSAHGPLQVLLFFSQIPPGADPGRGQNRSRRGPLLQQTFSSDWEAIATNRIHSNDLEACGM